MVRAVPSSFLFLVVNNFKCRYNISYARNKPVWINKCQVCGLCGAAPGPVVWDGIFRNFCKTRSFLILTYGNECITNQSMGQIEHCLCLYGYLIKPCPSIFFYVLWLALHWIALWYSTCVTSQSSWHYFLNSYNISFR